jgi:hypothetical protein
MKLCRFLYINIYAFLLFALGIVLFVLPMEIFLLALKILTVVWSAAGGIVIFSQGKMKLRKIPVLVARNRKELRTDTFKTLQGTLCGRLMVTAALADLRKSENYCNLSNADWENCKARALGKNTRGKKKNHR